MPADDPSALPGHSILPEPLLLFSGGKTDVAPLRGLDALGPYSADLGLVSRIRIAYLAPQDYMDQTRRPSVRIER